VEGMESTNIKGNIVMMGGISMLPKLKLEDIKIGMKVNMEQLSEIRDIWILVEEEAYGADSGVVRFVGVTPNNESQAVLDTGKPIACIYNDSEILDGEVVFDE